MAMRALKKLMESKMTRNRLDLEPTLDYTSEDMQSSSDEDISVSREKRPKPMDDASKGNRPPLNEKGTDSELSKTNALLQTLLKRMERQEKKLCEMESKLTQSSSPSHVQKYVDTVPALVRILINNSVLRMPWPYMGIKLHHCTTAEERRQSLLHRFSHEQYPF